MHFGLLYTGSEPVLETMLLSGCRIPVVRLLWEQVDRVQFPASRQWYCLTVQGTVVVPKEMETGFLQRFVEQCGQRFPIFRLE